MDSAYDYWQLCATGNDCLHRSWERPQVWLWQSFLKRASEWHHCMGTGQFASGLDPLGPVLVKYLSRILCQWSSSRLGRWQNERKNQGNSSSYTVPLRPSGHKTALPWLCLSADWPNFWFMIMSSSLTVIQTRVTRASSPSTMSPYLPCASNFLLS